jgi:shikimate dehydrogenase
MHKQKNPLSATTEAGAAGNAEKPDDHHQKIQEKAKEIEIGGPKGLEPTRYGDWEKAGRCIDF